MTEEEKLEFSKKVSPETVYKMAEGNPDNRTDITSGDEPIQILGGITNKDD